ncbi:VOC family protein [Streptomyces sp. NPDC001070]
MARCYGRAAARDQRRAARAVVNAAAVGVLPMRTGTDRVSRPPSAPAGVVAHWHVDDIESTWKRLLSLGAREHEAPRDHGHGFVAGAAVDPFGNLLGVMHNPHFVEVTGGGGRPVTDASAEG